MKILINSKWKDGFLDYHPHPNEYIIQVLAWRSLERSEGLYFVRPKSLRLIWNYLLEIGLVAVFRKILSRGKERYRNEKYISCGVGRVLESFGKTKFGEGQIVSILAPDYPACIERIALCEELIFEIDQSIIPSIPENTIVYVPLRDIEARRGRWWSDFCGWSNYSGQNVYDEPRQLCQKLQEAIRHTNWRDGLRLQLNEPTKISYRNGQIKSKKNDSHKRAVLFGYGNYAKTIILPNIKKYLNVEHIHEVDPMQIPVESRLVNLWDTSPNPTDPEEYDVYLIAGFHHTHAPLAIIALEHGACAVVEKPIVVTKDQLADLLTAMKNSAGRLFCCFHKRYLPMNRWAFEDMEVIPGKPVSYHCIVYEVPLPEFHWYRWQNSKSRLISNGCHWIDHFLYLNNFCEVYAYDLSMSKDCTISCFVELRNGACFTMTLTDKGSERIGVQDYIEVRANNATIKMINGSRYLAENKDRIIRKRRINKMESYKKMYQQIGQRILDDADGDSIQSVKSSCSLVLALDNKLSDEMQVTLR
jgi:predicted dehydrogenase